MGRLEEAIALHERTLTDCERVLALITPRPWPPASSLAVRLPVGRGPREGGRAVGDDPHRQPERILGADHPDTLTSRNLLAAAYLSVGRLEEAIALLERTSPTATDPGRRTPRHPDVPQPPRRRLRSAGRLVEANALLEHDPHRPRDDPGRRTPRHVDTREILRASTPRRGATRRRSRCSSEPWPTVSASWAPTTPTP